MDAVETGVDGVSGGRAWWSGVGRPFTAPSSLTAPDWDCVVLTIAEAAVVAGVSLVGVAPVDVTIEPDPYMDPAEVKINYYTKEMTSSYWFLLL